jgi:hypothetical protein
MRRNRILMIACALLTSIDATVAVIRWRQTVLRPAPRAARAVVGASNPVSIDAPVGEDDVSAVVANDPFRLSNTPSRVAFDAGGSGGPGDSGSGTPLPPPSRPSRPTLVLKAIVGGPPWQAVIDGLPGQSAGAVATPGTVFQNLIIRSVSRDRVVVEGPDTSWVLTFGGAP